MSDDVAMMRKIFEKWFSAQFPTHGNLLEYDVVDGYVDEHISAVFIGFCAGLMLAQQEKHP